MQTITIDEEFLSLLPKLDEETYKSLESSIIRNGCMEALVVWNGILMDGHNRYEICTRHGIPFETVDIEFSSREEALIWIITMQVSRRNLTPMQLSHFRGLHYQAEKKIITNESGRNQYKVVDGQNDHQPKTLSTAGFLAAKYKVSPKTIMRDAKLAEGISSIGEVSLAAKRSILSGEVSIGKQELERFSGKPREEIEAFVDGIENGEYEKKRAASSASAKQVSPADRILAVFTQLGAAVSKAEAGILSDLDLVPRKAERTALKKALKAHMDKLEELYSLL